MDSVNSTEYSPRLIRTRLNRPSLPGDYVERPRLLDQLNRGLDRPLTLVSAPAGFGKSILVSAWLDTCRQPSAWLALDESADDLGVFLHYFSTTVQTVAPGSLQRTQSLLAGFSLPPLEVLAASLINELDEINHPFVVVLEDYHNLHAPEIHDLLAALLRHPPAPMHLVIISRQDPPLPIISLRARNEVAEVRVQDLRFSAAEATIFMQRVLGAPLPDGALIRLLEKTEGWIASLRLVALSVRYSDDAGGRLTALQGIQHSRYVADYLMSEVLGGVPSERKGFLLRSAILDRMCAPVCNAVLDLSESDVHSQNALEWLEQNNLFIISLDMERRWYRYHHLFESFLRSQLERTIGPGEIALLHRRASAWFATQGLLEEALHHALLGQDMPAAVRLMADHRHALMDAEQWQIHEHLLHMFPSETVPLHPDLTLMAAWMARLGKYDAAHLMDLLQRAEYLIARTTEPSTHDLHLQGEIATLRAIVAYEAATDPEYVLSLARQALNATPVEWYYVRSTAWLYLAVGNQMAGRLPAAYAAVAEGQLEDVTADGRVRVRIEASRCFVDWIAGNLPAMVLEANHMLAVGETYQRGESLGWARYLLSSINYERNDLATAEAHVLAMEDVRYASRPMAYLQGVFIYASIFQANAMPELARSTLERAFSFVKETRSEGLLPLVLAFQADLAVRQNDLGVAGQWASTTMGLAPRLAAMPYYYAPQMTLPKVLLALNTVDSLHQADTLLAELSAFVRAIHNTSFTIEVLALQALLRHAQDSEQEALQLLGEALRLAQPGGFVRKFADLGPAMACLLEKYAATTDEAGYPNQLLQAFAVIPPAPKPSLSTIAAAQPMMVEPLTRRERDVLALLAQRLTAGEIAHQLVLSEQTVKRHRANIYQKLGVSSRQEAVAAAIALGLLPTIA